MCEYLTTVFIIDVLVHIIIDLVKCCVSTDRDQQLSKAFTVCTLGMFIKITIYISENMAIWGRQYFLFNNTTQLNVTCLHHTMVNIKVLSFFLTA